MDTEKCRALICAIEEGTLTAAAEKLGYTASGISRMMQSLEEETGFPLLVRSRGGVVPTKECESLLPVMREITYHAGRFEQLAAEILGLETGSITIGVSYGAYYHWLAKLVKTFSAAHPGIKVNIFWGTSTELSEAIAERRADFCVMSRRDGHGGWISLRRDELLALAPKDHPLVKVGSVSKHALETEPLIEVFPGEETDNSIMFRRLHIKPNVRFSCNDALLAYAMVGAGLGISFINSVMAESASGDTVALPLDPPYYVDIGIALSAAEDAPPVVKKFIAFAKTHIDEL